jgi:hypothetical protein
MYLVHQNQVRASASWHLAIPHFLRASSLARQRAGPQLGETITRERPRETTET